MRATPFAAAWSTFYILVEVAPFNRLAEVLFWWFLDYFFHCSLFGSFSEASQKAGAGGLLLER